MAKFGITREPRADHAKVPVASAGFGRVLPSGPVAAPGLRSTPHHKPTAAPAAKPTLAQPAQPAQTVQPVEPVPEGRVPVAAYTRRRPGSLANG